MKGAKYIGQWTLSGSTVEATLQSTAGNLVAVTVGGGWYTKSTQTTYVGKVTRIDDKCFDLATAARVITLSFLDVEKLQPVGGAS